VTREELLQRCNRISTELADRHDILANLLPTERRIKVETFLQAAGSDTVRRNAADQASLHVSEQVLRIQSEIRAREIELENAKLQLYYTS